LSASSRDSFCLAIASSQIRFSRQFRAMAAAREAARPCRAYHSLTKSGNVI
jgi:hypothetical protein